MLTWKYTWPALSARHICCPRKSAAQQGTTAKSCPHRDPLLLCTGLHTQAGTWRSNPKAPGLAAQRQGAGGNCWKRYTHSRQLDLNNPPACESIKGDNRPAKCEAKGYGSRPSGI